MDKIYIVYIKSYDWDSVYVTNLKAFAEEIEANKFCDTMQASVPKYSDYLERVFSRCCQMADYLAAKKYPHWDNWSEQNSVYESIVESFEEKIRAKYPDLTSDWSESVVTYHVEEVELVKSK